MFPLKNKQFRFSWRLAKGFNFLKRQKNQFKMLLENCIIEYVQTKSVFNFQRTKSLCFMTVKSAKPALKCLIFHLKTKNRHICCLVMMVQIACKKDESRLWKIWKRFSANHNQAHPNLIQKGQNSFHLWHNRVDSPLVPLVDTVNQKFISILFLNSFSLQWNKMNFSVSNDRIDWSLDFAPDSVTRSVKDLFREKTISSHEVLPAAWSLLLSQRQDFLSNHLAQVPFTPKPGRENGDEGGIVLRCRCPKYGRKWVSNIWPGRRWNPLG